jgi:hypothetical protein
MDIFFSLLFRTRQFRGCSSFSKTLNYMLLFIHKQIKSSYFTLHKYGEKELITQRFSGRVNSQIIFGGKTFCGSQQGK